MNFSKILIYLIFDQWSNLQKSQKHWGKLKLQTSFKQYSKSNYPTSNASIKEASTEALVTEIIFIAATWLVLPIGIIVVSRRHCFSEMKTFLVQFYYILAFMLQTASATTATTTFFKLYAQFYDRQQSHSHLQYTISSHFLLMLVFQL